MPRGLQKALYVENTNTDGISNGDMQFMSVTTPEEAASFVRKWMDARKVFGGDKSDESKDKAYFSYQGAIDNGVNFSVQQPKDLVRVVGITTRVVIDSQQQKALADLDSQERNEFIKKLNNSLLAVDPAYILGPKPESLEWVLFIKEISYDELTEGRLMDSVDKINRAVLFASSIIIDKLGEPLKEKTQ